MMCAWKELLSILPVRLRREVDCVGKETLQELRLRINAPPELVLKGDRVWLSGCITRQELDFVINTASKYSPWCSASVSRGYLTAPGGHRIGICGEVIYKNGTVAGFREISSLCIRVARDFSGIGEKLLPCSCSVLILGAPGWGKTTLLRDVIRQLAARETVSVVDERGELFPENFDRGKSTDILTGCPKYLGIEMVLRTMGPDWIALDEITAQQDCRALIEAANCGIRLLATAHAGSLKDFYSRAVYQPLIAKKIFETIVIMQKDKSWKTERMTI